MITVREASGDDAHEIACVHVAAWREAYRGLIPDKILRNLSTDDCARSWTRILGGATAATLVAVEGARIIGFVSLGPSHDDDASAGIGQLYTIYLLPDRWREGIGTQLHDAALHQLADKRFSTATLWVLGINDRAISFYYHHGWARDGQTKTEPGPGGSHLEEVRLQRRLSRTPNR